MDWQTAQKHFRVWWKVYASLLLFWLTANALPSLLQGASNELLQDMHGYLTQFNRAIGKIKRLWDWL